MILAGFWEAPGGPKIDENLKHRVRGAFGACLGFLIDFGRILGGFWVGFGRIFGDFWMDLGMHFGGF
jgi:hypothetical protein